MATINEGASSELTGELFRASGLSLNSSSDTVTAAVVNQVTGVSGPIDISQISNGLLVVNIGSVSGASPSLAVFFDVEDGFGNWVLTSNATAISGAAMAFAGTVFGNISTGYVLTNRGRIRWTVSGTFTNVSFSLWGR